MELAQPLAVGNVALASPHVVHIAGIDQQYVETAVFQDLVERDPVDSGRFHGHGFDSTLQQPVRQPVQVGGEGAELAHRLRVALGRDRYEMAVLSAVNPGRVGLDAFEQ